MKNKETTETLEQFSERMSNVEKTKELIVGQAHLGNTRAVFEFEGQVCFLESFGYRRVEWNDDMPPLGRCLQAIYNPPTDNWVYTYLFYTKKRANRLMKYYGAKFIEEDPYPREEGVWFSLVFPDFESLMKIVYDTYTGKFKELWGENEKDYESCFEYLEGK